MENRKNLFQLRNMEDEIFIWQVTRDGVKGCVYLADFMGTSRIMYIK